MPLKIKAKCQTELLSHLQANLPDIDVKNGQILESLSTFVAIGKIDDKLPQTGKLRDELETLTTDRPLYEFTLDQIEQKLEEAFEYSTDDAKVKLTSLAGFEDSNKISQEIITSFISLPWTYTLTIELPIEIPEFLLEVLDEFQFDENSRIVLANTSLDHQFPRTHPNSKRNEQILSTYILFKPEVNWKTKTAIFQTKTNGYIDRFGTTEPAKRAVERLRAFLGLGIALGLFKPSYAIDNKRCDIWVHKKTGEEWELDGQFRLPGRFAKTLHHIEIPSTSKVENLENYKSFYEGTLKTISKLFSEEKTTHKIILAAQWLYDSYCVEDQLLSFIQTMVALEILAGDTSDNISIGKALKNRVAYSIAKDHIERKKIMDDIEKIYKVRSNIIHTGKNGLNYEERILFISLRDICTKVIKEEIKMCFPPKLGLL